MSLVDDHGDYDRLSTLILLYPTTNSTKRYAFPMSNTCACETLDAMCRVLNVCCTTWRTEDADGVGYWSLEAIDSERQEYTVNHEDLLEAVCILAELLQVDLGDI